MLSGILEADRGEVWICGERLTGGGVRARRLLGYVPDTTKALPDLMVREFVRLVASLTGVALDRPGEARETLPALRAKLGVEAV